MLETVLAVFGLSIPKLIAGAVALGGIAATVLGFWFKAKASGRAEERAKQDAATNQLMKDKLDVDQAVDRLSPSDARDRLSEWTKT